jgi:hypothetical protein
LKKAQFTPPLLVHRSLHLLKEWTTSERERAETKRELQDEVELMLNQKHVAIGLLEAKA